MGRQNRQTRRSQERRQEQRQARQTGNQQRQSKTTGPNWSIIAGVVVVLAVAAVLVTMAVRQNSTSAGSDPNAVANSAKKVDGYIGCNAMEQITYHVHAHVQVMDKGKAVPFDRYAGENYNHDCLYWLHAHDSSGIIHIESPNKILPTLGTWYHVDDEQLSPTQVGKIKVKPGEQVKTWVSTTVHSGGKTKTVFKPYTGDPAKIHLVQHTQVWIDVGPPFLKPTNFDFAAHNV